MRIEVESGVWLVILSSGVCGYSHDTPRCPAAQHCPGEAPQGNHAARLIEFTPLLIHHR
jgi:hypothetical protein